jgi:mevalonate kinase
VPAIAASIERGASATATLADEFVLELGETRARPNDGSDIGRAFAAITTALASPPARVQTTIDLPPGCGLGASAALGVAIARALLQLRPADSSTHASIIAAANAWESVFHGNASGVDTAAAAHQGCIWFERDKPVIDVPLSRPLSVAIAVAAPPASTKEMVGQVARLKERRPEVVAKALSGIESLVKNARLCLEAGDLTGLGRLLDLNQMILSGLFLSSEAIETACATARSAGALGAKLTGAGGGGCVIALVDEPDPVLSAWQRLGLECFSTVVSPTPPQS